MEIQLTSCTGDVKSLQNDWPVRGAALTPLALPCTADRLSTQTHHAALQLALSAGGCAMALPSMALPSTAYRNWCACSPRDSRHVGRAPRAMLHAPGCSLPVRTVRYNRDRSTSLACAAARSPFGRGRDVAMGAASQQLEEAQTAPTNGGGPASGAHHDNGYTEPALRPSTLTVHGAPTRRRRCCCWSATRAMPPTAAASTRSMILLAEQRVFTCHHGGAVILLCVCPSAQWVCQPLPGPCAPLSATPAAHHPPCHRQPCHQISCRR